MLFAGGRAGPPHRVPRPGGDGRRRLRHAVHALPAGPVLRLPRPVVGPRLAPATRTSSRRCRSARAAGSASGSARAPRSGASCPRPTPTSSSPSSARSSGCSARCSSSCCSRALGVPRPARRRSRRPTPSAGSWPPASPRGSACRRFVNIGAVIGILPITGVPAALRQLRQLGDAGQHGGGRDPLQHLPRARGRPRPEPSPDAAADARHLRDRRRGRHRGPRAARCRRRPRGSSGAGSACTRRAPSGASRPGCCPPTGLRTRCCPVGASSARSPRRDRRQPRRARRDPPGGGHRHRPGPAPPSPGRAGPRRLRVVPVRGRRDPVAGAGRRRRAERAPGRRQPPRRPASPGPAPSPSPARRCPGRWSPATRSAPRCWPPTARPQARRRHAPPSACRRAGRSSWWPAVRSAPGRSTTPPSSWPGSGPQPRRPRPPPRGRTPGLGGRAATSSRARLHYDRLEYEDRMPLALAAADVGVFRSGSGTCFEVAAVGLPVRARPVAVRHRRPPDRQRPVARRRRRRRAGARRRAHRRAPGRRGRRPPRRPRPAGRHGRGAGAPSPGPTRPSAIADLARAARPCAELDLSTARCGSTSWASAAPPCRRSPRSCASMGHQVSGSDLTDVRAPRPPAAPRASMPSSATTPPTSAPTSTSSPCPPPSPTATPSSPRRASAGVPVAQPGRDARRHLRHPAHGGGVGHPRQDHDRRRCSPSAAVGGGLRPSFLVGGDLNELGSGVVWEDGEWFVVEADESDGTFLELPAEIVVVTNVEADHLDHYGDARRHHRGASTASSPRPPARGSCAPTSPTPLALARRHGATTYGTARRRRLADRRPASRRGSACAFRLERRRRRRWARSQLPVPGPAQRPQRHRRARRGRGHRAPTSTPARRALGRYAGVARRFQFRGEAGGVTFVDDYAHNPGKVAAVLAAARAGRVGPGGRACSSPTATPARPTLWREFGPTRSPTPTWWCSPTSTPPASRPSPGRHRQARSSTPSLDAHPWKRVAWLPDRGRRAALPARRAAPRRPVPHRSAPATSRRCPTSSSPPSSGRAVTTATCRPTRPSGGSRSLGRPRCAPTCRSGRCTTYRVGGAAALLVEVADDDDLARRARRRGGDRASPSLVVGKGSNLLVADAGFAGLAVVLGDGVRRRSTVDGTTRAGRRRGRACPSSPAARGRRPHRLRVGGRRARLGRRRGAHERRRPRLGHGRQPARASASSTSPAARMAWCPPTDLDLGYRRSSRPARPRSCVGADARPRARRPGRRARPSIAEIVRWRREQPARRPERRLGVHQPAGRLRRPAHRGRRAQGPAASGPPRCRTKHANFIQADAGRLGRRRARARCARCAGGSPTPPASSCTPRPCWSASTLDRRSRVDGRPQVRPTGRRRAARSPARRRRRRPAPSPSTPGSRARASRSRDEGRRRLRRSAWSPALVGARRRGARRHPLAAARRRPRRASPAASGAAGRRDG